MSADLQALLDEVLPPQSLPQSWPETRPQGAIARVRYTHEAMIDMMIANPCISQNELAAQFGYTPSWVSQVITSDAFQAKMAERTEKIIDPTLRATIEQRFKGIMMRSLEVLMKKLDRRPEDIPDNLALRTFEVASRAAGYGAKVNVNVSQTNNTQINHLESLGANLVGLLRRKKAEVQDSIDLGDSDAR